MGDLLAAVTTRKGQNMQQRCVCILLLALVACHHAQSSSDFPDEDIDQHQAAAGTSDWEQVQGVSEAPVTSNVPSEQPLLDALEGEELIQKPQADWEQVQGVSESPVTSNVQSEQPLLDALESEMVQAPPETQMVQETVWEGVVPIGREPDAGEEFRFGRPPAPDDPDRPNLGPSVEIQRRHRVPNAREFVHDILSGNQHDFNRQMKKDIQKQRDPLQEEKLQQRYKNLPNKYKNEAVKAFQSPVEQEESETDEPTDLPEVARRTESQEDSFETAARADENAEQRGQREADEEAAQADLAQEAGDEQDSRKAPADGTVNLHPLGDATSHTHTQKTAGLLEETLPASLTISKDEERGVDLRPKPEQALGRKEEEAHRRQSVRGACDDEGLAIC